MKVKRLIEELQKCDPEASVHLHGNYGAPAIFLIRPLESPMHVYLEDMQDVDLCNQIDARYLSFEEDAQSTSDEEALKRLFEDLYCHDIFVEDVRLAINDKAADDYTNYLKEGNLKPPAMFEEENT